MNSVFDYLKLRVVPLSYTAPAICEYDFTGSDLGELILPPLSSEGLPGFVWESTGEGWQFHWDAYPGAICYTVFKANGDGSYTVVADCIANTYFDGLEDGCYRVEAITEEGSVATSTEICVEDGGTVVVSNGLRILPFSMPRGRFGAINNYTFGGPSWEGGHQTPTWSFRPPDDWPTGMTFARATGGFSGKPVKHPSVDRDLLYVGLSTFRATTRDQWAELYNVEWRIDPQIRITSGPSITTLGPGVEFVQTLTATNVLGTTAWSTLDDPETWPDWFNLSSSGQMSVIPPSADPYTFTAVVQDTGGVDGIPSRNQLEITLVNDSVCSGSLAFVGDTTAGEVWNRVSANGTQPPFYLSNIGTAVPYEVHEFTAPCTGQLTADLYGDGGWFVSLTAYSGGFFADYPLCGTPPGGGTHCYAAVNDYGEPVCDPMPSGSCLPVQGNDEFPVEMPEAGRAQVSFPMVQGVTYYFVVSGFENTDVGAYTLSLTWTPPPPP